MKGQKGKSPAIQWYYKDWLSDRKLQMASPTSRGIWMNILMYMIDCSIDGEDCEPGELANLSTRQIMSLGSCNEDEAKAFIEDALAFKFCDISVTDHGIVTIKSRRLKRDGKNRINARERKRKQREREKESGSSRKGHKKVTPASPSPSPNPTPIGVNDAYASSSIGPCPQQKIIELYHKTLPELPAVNSWPDHLQKILRTRWREDPERQSLDWWRAYFEYVKASDFLMGKKNSFTADLEWIVRPKNFTKIINGRYHKEMSRIHKNMEAFANAMDRI